MIYIFRLRNDDKHFHLLFICCLTFLLCGMFLMTSFFVGLCFGLWSVVSGLTFNLSNHPHTAQKKIQQNNENKAEKKPRGNFQLRQRAFVLSGAVSPCFPLILHDKPAFGASVFAQPASVCARVCVFAVGNSGKERRRRRCRRSRHHHPTRSVAFFQA